MAFHSAAFLFFYIPVIFLFYLVIPGPRAKNVYLTIAGLIFYACGQWQGVPVLVLSALLAWLAGRSGRKGVLALTLVCQVAMLGVFKYLDFFTGTLNDLLGLNIPAANLLLPIGVSFFTFKAMAYTIDAYRDGGTSRRFLDVLLYLSFFPQVVSGPIERYGQFAEDLEDRPLNAVQMAHGLRRFIIGFAKKALLSETAALAANGAFGLEAGLDFRLAWLGAFAYTIQIYFDFSGYSDMAIGLGELFGFRTPENFDYPYISASITEFWRRWHISLSFWFRDYLYIPLGGGRCGKLRKCLNKCAVFLLCGLWHGELDVCALGRVARAVFRAGKRPSPTAVHGIPADSGARLHASGGLYRLCTVPGVGPRRSVPDAASDVYARHFRPVDVCTGTDGAVGLAGAGGRRGRFHAGDPLAAEAASGAAV